MSRLGASARVLQGIGRSGRARVARTVSRTSLVVQALPSRSRQGRRREQLDRELGRLPEAPEPSGRWTLVLVGDDTPLPSEPQDTFEVVAVRSSLSPRPPALIHRVVTQDEDETLAGAVDRAIRGATTEIVAIVGPSVEPGDGRWLRRLAAEVRGDCFAAAPVRLHPQRPWWRATPYDLRVREAGLDLAVNGDGAPVPVARHAGSSLGGVGPPAEVFAAPGTALVVSRAAYERAGGFPPIDDLGAAGVVLCQRFHDIGGRVVVVPSAVVVDRRPVRSRAALNHGIDPDADGWRAAVDHAGPALSRAASGTSIEGLRFVITVGAPSMRAARRWGDWHLAQAFARSLRRLGHIVRVQSVAEVDALVSRAADVHLVVRGKSAIRATPGQRQVLWVMSHPDELDVEECHRADLVLVASSRFAAELAPRTATPVEVFLQATDHHRFQPVPPDAAFAHDVAIVANARHVLRTIVADALAAGLHPAIYGRGWNQVVDPALVIAEQIPNDRLPLLYSSVGVLLNDHWDDMRAWGFVSNRVFDALACGAPLISDDLPELDELFGDAVITYSGPSDLRSSVERVLADRPAARRRALDGREVVLGAHTFDHRARTLLELLARDDVGRTS